ncbi:hypothetical protein QYE76_028065 [Lolium multiflorum]|uniref:Integrase catalytic domain-containing protein n=1 Tax=Lolium multiflorum TaxID=4521 RepID=A0AAD8QMZ8_LOLMU|nr:hypothetical protein QYE76_028065 [Lolium multiflorum]
MELLLDAGEEAVEIFGDSKLVISQLTEEYKCESESLFPLSMQCRELMAQFRFGIPQTITTDGGSVFVSKEFRKFCEDMGIKLIRLSPYYAQANGQAEASNKSLIKLIKRKIDEHPRRWHEAGSRRITFQNDLTEEYAALMSDSIEDATELRLWSLEKIKENKAKVAHAYNKKVKPKEFHVGDLVWEVVLPLGTKDKAYDPSLRAVAPSSSSSELSALPPAGSSSLLQVALIGGLLIFIIVVVVVGPGAKRFAGVILEGVVSPSSSSSSSGGVIILGERVVPLSDSSSHQRGTRGLHLRWSRTCRPRIDGGGMVLLVPLLWGALVVRRHRAAIGSHCVGSREEEEEKEEERSDEAEEEEEEDIARDWGFLVPMANRARG